MVDVYTKMKPDSFKLQLQAVLTAFYEDIKGVQGASCCPKIKVIKRRFADQDEAEDDDGAAAADSSNLKEPDAVAAAAPAAATAAPAPAPAAAAAAAAAEAAPTTPWMRLPPLPERVPRRLRELAARDAN